MSCKSKESSNGQHCSCYADCSCCYCGKIWTPQKHKETFPSTPKMLSPKIKRARELVNRLHGQQKYGEFPYIVHLWDVAQVAQRFEYGEMVIIACLLHDTLEDTVLTYNEIHQEFGREIADAVLSVTKDKTLSNRKKKNEEVNARTAMNFMGCVVKLCDRIANCESGEKNDMYRKEHYEFKRVLSEGNLNRWCLLQPLWDHLDDLLGLNKQQPFTYSIR